jgi:hypothetical protein
VGVKLPPSGEAPDPPLDWGSYQTYTNLNRKVFTRANNYTLTPVLEYEARRPSYLLRSYGTTKCSKRWDAICCLYLSQSVSRQTDRGCPRFYPVRRSCRGNADDDREHARANVAKHPRPGRMKTTDKQMIVVDSAQQNPFHNKANFCKKGGQRSWSTRRRGWLLSCLSF